LDIGEEFALIEPGQLGSAVDMKLVRRCLVRLTRFLAWYRLTSFFGLHDGIGIALSFPAVCRGDLTLMPVFVIYVAFVPLMPFVLVLLIATNE
jgi:hypothetical protein